MTYLELVNGVLKRLRESEVTSVAASAYATLISEMVNEVKREVEDAFDWLSLEASVVISTVAGTDSYTLTDFGRRGKVRYVHNVTNKGRILQTSVERFRRLSNFSDLSDSQPSWWIINGLQGDDPIIQFLPAPETTYTINVYGIAPQADLVNNTDDLVVPSYPVLLGAYALAVAERGDDRGNTITLAQAQYQSALSDAIAIDNNNRAQGQYTDWYLA